MEGMTWQKYNLILATFLFNIVIGQDLVIPSQCRSVIQIPSDPNIQECIEEHSDNNYTRWHINYILDEASIQRCECYDALIQLLSTKLLDCLNYTSCISLCYHSHEQICKKIPCSAITSAVDICIISVEEKELVLGAYGVSCRTLSQHTSDICNALQDSPRGAIIITGSLVAVVILCVGIGIAIASIIIYVNRKNKQNLSVHQEPDNVLISLESPLYATNTEQRHSMIIKEKMNMYKQQFVKVLHSSSDIQYIHELGEGAFGKVYKGIWNTSNGEITVAIKTILKVNSIEEVEEFVSESAVMLDFDHPNVLKLLGVCFDTDDQLPVIILPYMANGDLKSFLIDKRGDNEPNILPEGLSIEILVKMCNDIANGMDYLSSLKFVHRDLAARNCMIDDKLSVKVADFGFSRDIYTKEYYRLERRTKLPVKWLPPESLLDNIYNEKTDVWSFGVVCWEVFSLGRSPYPGIDNGDIPEYISNGYRLKQPTLCPNEVYVIMCECWDHNPMERPAFSQLIVYLNSDKSKKENPYFEMEKSERLESPYFDLEKQ